ncbi:glucose-6-phosphate dehydrogenase assembly protein OpcA [Nocardioides panacihumi]|uniref:Glucose-6-phosphate dehydrogenase assembly protein OpcA n=1 Tax=Nocardioides panacihumi TaxID=400774 RepID=A0ABN2S0S5_9ACTN
MITIEQTNAAGIAAELVRARRHAGSPAMGMVLTLVIVVEEEYADAALDQTRQASREHPARVLAVVLGDKRGHGTVNAAVGIGNGWGGETALIRLTGEVAKHPESVVLPLLLPDSPVVIWWPHDAPADPAGDPLGRLAQRRITDSASVGRNRSRLLRERCDLHAPGNTDLAWTRLTPWRALLAAALDQHPVKVTGASVSSERANPSADLLVAWLEDRLRVPVARRASDGPGITQVTLDTAAGPIRIARPDGRLATFTTPGRPDRPIALKRRDVPELLAEELRRLDEDEVYAATARRLAHPRPTRKKAR